MSVRTCGAAWRASAITKKKGASCEPFEKHGYAAPVLVTFGGTCVQVKAAIPVPAHLGRAGRLRVPTRCEPALLRTCMGGRPDKYASPSHVTGTTLRRSDNQIHVGAGPQCRSGPAGQWLPGQLPVIAPGNNRLAGEYLPVRGQARGAGGEPVTVRTSGWLHRLRGESEAGTAMAGAESESARRAGGDTGEGKGAPGARGAGDRDCV